MKRPSRAIATAATALLVLILWSCSSSPKAKTSPKTAPAPAQTPPQTPPQPEEKKTPPPSSAGVQEIEIPPSEKLMPPAEDPGEEKSATEQDLSSLLEEALNACQEAQAASEKEDFEAALALLDTAYSLLLRAEIPLDSPLSQEKSDLRLMIAKRIQTIHASRLVPVTDNNKTIPLVENKYVLAEIESFRTRERKSFEEAYMRSGFYREMIVGEMRRAGLPDDLSWLPIIESGFKVRALSRARALGLWQFISSTASLYDLKRDRWIDERMDPLKATRAAIRYLTELHNLFGDWTTALAGYNCGEYRVQRVIRSQQIDYLDNFWDLFAQLPYETARFVPRFIAALLIIKNPEKYGFTLPGPYPPLNFEIITVHHASKLSSLSSNLGLESSELAFLNPELRYDATPDYAYELKIPVGLSERASQSISNIPRWIPPEATYTWYTVRRGDSLSTIASRHRTSVTALKRLNSLRSNLIRAGQRLKIPGRGTVSSSGSTSVAVSGSSASGSPSSGVDASGEKYKVDQGDTLFGIARRLGLDLDEFLSLNGLNRDSVIYPGQELLLPKK